MYIYLVRISNPDKDLPFRHKSGLTSSALDKLIENRFTRWDDWNGLNVELLCYKHVSHPNYRIAKRICERWEKKIFEYLPKKEYGNIDNVEESLGVERRNYSFGCTEFHRKDLSENEELLITEWLKITGGERYVQQKM